MCVITSPQGHLDKTLQWPRLKDKNAFSELATPCVFSSFRDHRALKTCPSANLCDQLQHTEEYDY